ncbi:MAG: ABC transporter ATP-binding protein [Oscillospiraceae bacterium]|nr:ABC transporter ATP-binding protein [Oscillospiraceae bacterium]
MLSIKNLSITFTNEFAVEAVHDVSLNIAPGERLGLVGESGSGKTMLALAISGLYPRSTTRISGEVLFNGTDILKCSSKELCRLRGKEIGMVFQEPMTSLNPLMKVGRQIEETLKMHTNTPPTRRRELALEAMESVELPDPKLTYEKYPHQLSGGQRQRAMIASAIIADPKLLIADEATTALDVTSQSQIIDLLARINERHGVAILFISHDLSVIRRLCNRVAVMHAGKIVEDSSTQAVFENPKDDYTKRLIAAIPTRDKRRRQT